MDLSSTRPSQRRASAAQTELPDLTSRLEKLDEERTRVQEELRRLQTAGAVLEQDADLPEGGSSNGEKQRVRFSKFDGIDASIVQQETPPSARAERPVSARRTSSAGAAMSRLSSYRNGPAGSSSDSLPGQRSRQQDPTLEAGRDLKGLTEMVNRGRRRTRYTHRSSASEASAGASSSATGDTKVSYLPRGGVHVNTKYGAVQFGLPPETIKDSMQMQLPVPAIFVVPKDRFNLKYGTNTAEVEFPGYWNFFIKGQSTTLVCTSEAANILSRVIDETLEGPAEEYLYTDDEYSAFVDEDTFASRPDHLKEINYFKEPRNGRVISTSTLVSFCIFSYNEDAQLCATLPVLGAAAGEAEEGCFMVIDDGQQYIVLVDGEEVCRVDDYLASAIEDPPHILMPQRTISSANLTEEFNTPDFGVTVLGSADGFSADGTTAGFVLWMRGRGILVDPPAHSAQYLHKNGISSRKVTHVILTHCHADHDAGTFQKILLEQRVTVMTTKTIMASFVRKYSLVSGMPDEFLLRLFFFHSAKIAEPVHFQGGTITFFYALHALPCIGFRAELGGKSITYSGDTFYDPDGLMKLQERGVISEERRQGLLHRGSIQPSDLLLHEAGVAPIHTPLTALNALDPALKKVLRIIHVGSKPSAAAAEMGIETVRVGFEHTLRVPVPALQHSDATNILHMLLQTDLFRSLDVNTAIDLLLVTNKRTYKPEEVIFRTGEPGDSLRIVQAGSVLLERDGVSRELRYCDYFGEGALLTDGTQVATATAATTVEMVEIGKSDFQYLMSRRPLLRERVVRRSQIRYNASWKAIGANSVFANFSMAQVTQLQSVMAEETVKAGTVLWKRGDIVKDVILVGEGRFYFKELPSTETEPFRPGALLVDVYSLEHRKPHRLTFCAQSDGKVFRINGSDILEFLDNNPGAFIWMRDTLLVE